MQVRGGGTNTRSTPLVVLSFAALRDQSQRRQHDQSACRSTHTTKCPGSGLGQPLDSATKIARKQRLTVGVADPRAEVERERSCRRRSASGSKQQGRGRAAGRQRRKQLRDRSAGQRPTRVNGKAQLRGDRNPRLSADDAEGPEIGELHVSHRVRQATTRCAAGPRRGDRSRCIRTAGWHCRCSH